MNKRELLKFTLESSVFIYSLYYYLKNRKKIASQSEMLSFIKRAYIFSPHSLKELIKDKNIYANNFLNL